MSKETLKSLQTNTVQGYGVKAWHYREGESRVPFEDAVPENFVEDLFPRILEVDNGHLTPAGVWVSNPDYKSLLREDTGASLAVVNESYAVHQYQETLLGMGLPIAAAGLLKEGRHAWVQYGTADSVITKDNVKFTTKLLAVTSADATLATQFKYVTTLAVCDNTLAIALGQGAAGQKVRHTRFSVPRVDDMRSAFGKLDDVAAQVADEFGNQIATEVTDSQINALLDELLPASKSDSDIEGRARTIAVNKREAVNERLTSMWDDYSGTKFGILQALDTAARWDWRTTDQEKVMAKTISGEFDKLMSDADRTLDLILA